MFNQPKTSLVVLILTYLAFISLGLPDSVLGVAWPAIRADLKLPLEALGVVTLVLTLVSAAASFGSGKLLGRFSTGPTIIVSTLVTAGALTVFANAGSMGVLILASIPLGLGAGSVDSGLNAYVARNYGAKHMNWLHAFWGGGATLGPMVMTLALGTGWGWRGGYLWIAGAQFVLATLFLVTLPFWTKKEPRENGPGTLQKVSEGGLGSRSTAATLSVGLYALYAGAELGTGLWAYSVLVNGRGVAPTSAGLWVSLFYGAVMGGRILVGFLVEKWGNRRLITLGLTVALGGAGFFTAGGISGLQGLLSPVGLALVGLGLAPVYPCLMHETPHRFKAEAAQVVIGWQVGAAYAGGALWPGLLGWTMARTSLEFLGPVVAGILVVMIFAVRSLNRRG